MFKKIIIGLIPALSFASGWMPGGSWTNSCTNASFHRGVLTAQCKTANGGTQTSSLRYDEACEHDSSLTNENGVLTCQHARSSDSDDDDGQYADNLPGGNWKHKCKVSSATLVNGIFSADCKSGFGVKEIKTLNYSQDCAPGSKIHYDHRSRQLICGSMRQNSQQPDDGLPAGDWRQHCDAAGARMVGNVLHASCKNWVGSSWPQTLSYDRCKPNSPVVYDSDDDDLKCKLEK